MLEYIGFIDYKWQLSNDDVNCRMTMNKLIFTKPYEGNINENIKQTQTQTSDYLRPNFWGLTILT